ncbi:ROK family protein [Bifidobacterium callimiconis]|uniref:NagC family transcriptional regulator n=1 Tax=Bifidobacterium callimiconis TaxID=2306973 RepID=A0A430FGR2_9BIFI|nr:ROK family protein [Bifidobacterium callimiconis]RSX51908.1 NagC family transcriptional regulator [Bifidobacterium callimiconis]
MTDHDDEMTHGDRAAQWFDGSPAMRRIAADILEYGPIARTTLAQMHDLSAGTVSRIIADLMYLGVVRETGDDDTSTGHLPYGFEPRKRTGERGRPQSALVANADARTFVGVKIRGDSATAVLVDAQCRLPDGAGSHVTEFADRTPAGVSDAVARLVEECRADARGLGLSEPCMVGLGIGAHITDGVVDEATFLSWIEPCDLSAMVRAATGLDTVTNNDLDALLMYEHWFGAGVGLPRFALLTIGTGIGYGLVEDGKVVDHADKTFGLAGHLLIDPDGPRCFRGCGHRGCAQCLTNDSLADEYSQIMGTVKSFDDYVRDAQNGVPQAKQLLMRECYRLGVMIGLVANLTMPLKVFVAGESAYVAGMEIESVRQGIAEYRPSRAATVPFEILGSDWERWAQGAAACAIRRYVLGE